MIHHHHHLTLKRPEELSNDELCLLFGHVFSLMQSLQIDFTRLFPSEQEEAKRLFSESIILAIEVAFERGRDVGYQLEENSSDAALNVFRLLKARHAEMVHVCWQERVLQEGLARVQVRHEELVQRMRQARCILAGEEQS